MVPLRRGWVGRPQRNRGKLAGGNQVARLGSALGVRNGVIHACVEKKGDIKLSNCHKGSESL